MIDMLLAEQNPETIALQPQENSAGVVNQTIHILDKGKNHQGASGSGTQSVLLPSMAESH